MGKGSAVRELRQTLAKAMQLSKGQKKQPTDAVVSRHFMKKMRALKKHAIDLDTQLRRKEAVTKLTDLVNTAIKQANASSKDPALQIKWLHVAGYCFQVLRSFLAGFDKSRIKADIEQLQKLMKDEFRKRGQKPPKLGRGSH